MLRSRWFLFGVPVVALLAVVWVHLHGRVAPPHADPDSSAPSVSSGVPPLITLLPAGGLGDILQPEGDQLTDMLGHLQTSCTAAAPPYAQLAPISVLTRCVEDAEGVMNLVDLLRGTIESPSGAALSADIRTRWDGTLSSATAAVRQVLTPVWEAVGHRLASGGDSPAEFRALGHLRDRIDRVLTAAGHP